MVLPRDPRLVFYFILSLDGKARVGGFAMIWKDVVWIVWYVVCS